MKVRELGLPGLKLIELNVFGDQRGFFVERFNRRRFEEHGIPSEYVQDNHSRSAPGVLRGLHYQVDPCQGKLVGVVRGRVWDVVVDIRPHSPTFGKHVGIELSDLNGLQLWVPFGFAHGFCVLGDMPADVVYKVDGYYNPKGEAGIMWNDPDLDIRWPVQDPVLSSRDQAQQSFRQYRLSPISLEFTEATSS